MYALPRLPDLLRISDFAEHVGSLYRVDASPAAVNVRLDSIKPGCTNPLGLREPFTLFFSTPFAALLTAGHYRVQAPDGRVVGIDLIPTQTALGPRRTYHAVFT